MKNIFKGLSSLFSYVSKRQLGLQGTLFLLFSVLSLLVGNSDRFWLFMITSILFTGMQHIIDEIKSLNK